MFPRHTKSWMINSGSVLTSSQNSFTVSNSIDLSPYTHVSVSKVSLPISYYSIDGANNTFSLVEGSTTQTITIPSTQYGVLNYVSFCTVFAGLLNTNSPNGYTYTITYDNDLNSVQRGKFTYTCSNTVNTVKLVFGDNNIPQLAGFDYSSTNTFSSGTLVSTQVFNFSPGATVLIHSDLIATETNQGIFIDVIANLQVAGAITFNPFSYINPDIISTAKTLDNKINQSWQFSLTDEVGSPIYLNSLNLSLEIIFIEMVDMYALLKEFVSKSIYFYKAVLITTSPDKVEELLSADPSNSITKEEQTQIEDNYRRKQYTEN